MKRFLYTSSTVVIFDSARELQFADESVPYPEKVSRSLFPTDKNFLFYAQNTKCNAKNFPNKY